MAGINTYITNPGKPIQAGVMKPLGEKSGLHILSRPAKVFENKIKFFVNDDNGADMAVDADTLSLNEGIHNGIDNVYWTASAISGTWDFNSLVNPRTGTHSIDATATVNDDIAQFLRPAGNLALASPISAVGVWVYLASWGAGVKSIDLYGWSTGSGAIVGTPVNLADYIDTTVLGSYQHAVVPLTDMNLQELTVDAFRIENTWVNGVQQTYYMDDIELLEGDLPLEYTVEPDKGTWLYVHDINATIVDEYDGIVTVAGDTENASMPSLRYDGFLGEAALTNGILYQRINSGEVKESFEIKQLFDIIRLPGTEVVGFGSDGTNSWVKIKVQITEALVLKSENNDVLKMSISDDISGLLEFQMSAGCREEVRQGDLYDLEY